MIQFNRSWWESTCSSAWRGCPCKNDQLPPMLRLRGLCPFSTMRTKNPTIGTRFTPVQRPDNLRNDWFKGGLSSKIELEGENPDNPSSERMKWTFSDVVWNVTAFTNAPKDSFALGKWEWTVTGDSGNCHKGKILLFLFLEFFLFRFPGQPYTTFLKLTGCLDGEFTCNDGECIQMEQRQLIFVKLFSIFSHIKGILHQKIFYRLNLIFWIVMGCGIARFGRRGLKTTET